MFGNLFTTYYDTDPPPIITEDYKAVKDNYENYVLPLIYSDLQYQEDIPFLDQNNQQEFLKTETTEFPSTSTNSSFLNRPSVNTPTKPNTPTKSTPIRSISPTRYSTSTRSTTSTSQRAVDIARQFVGTKYHWGGSSPSTGFDCSGLINYAYSQAGIKLPRTVKDLAKAGTKVNSLDDVQVGDIICSSNSSSPSGNHAQIVSKIDNGQIYTIEALGKKYGIIESPLKNTKRITSIRRITNKTQDNVIIDYFINKGLTRNQAKGIYGNLMQESGGNIKAISGDGNNSYGLAQWTGPRKQKLFSMYGINPTIKQQLDFLWWELNNTHKDALLSLKKTTTVSQATKVFMDKFERPHKDYANFNRRLRYANSIV